MVKASVLLYALFDPTFLQAWQNMALFSHEYSSHCLSLYHELQNDRLTPLYRRVRLDIPEQAPAGHRGPVLFRATKTAAPGAASRAGVS